MGGVSKPFRAIVFDLDGLIVDTEQPIFNSYSTILAEYGLELPISVWEDVIGRGGVGQRDPLFEHLEGELGRSVDRDAIRERARAMHRDAAQRLPAREGVAEWVAQAQDAGLLLGVASSSSRAWVEGHLARLGLLPSFDAVCVREDVRHTKPHPELYELAVARLGVAPEEAFALEDSPNGVTAAKAAGLRCVAAPNPLTAQMDLRHADYVLPSLAGVSLAEVMSALAGPPAP